ncbi:Aminoglycoside 3'-phosphotransferase [Sphingomonas sp. EC-HK361]|uniref:APH(3') family aminoglycoside O-phosphotransferase n=1 Tax=Sphingomonas sp. EC-HK361 TaxID=2038397 RepID=UPI0012539B4B|nr:APH(3') family aminoglycoside O-phosphotransferase [Sphingomonas sp. EC-HK361]VVT07504.1 Aminoglycoside 3'-phosphotransferase [Sphingomonas sp. EC-HK361]
MAVTLPPSLADTIDGYRWARERSGESGGTVFRLDAEALPSLYLKHGKGRVAADIFDEATRLTWLADVLPVPEVRHFVATPDAAWLLTTAIPGQTADALLADDAANLPTIIDGAAAFLRRLHAIPAANCPFEAGHAHRLAAARRNIDAGLVDEEDFDSDHDGWSAEDVWDELVALQPFAAERSVTHGDYSLGNLLFADGAVVGCIDVGRAGLADPYQDIAIFWQNLAEFGEGAQNAFVAALGIELDERRLRFHRCLDELF